MTGRQISKIYVLISSFNNVNIHILIRRYTQIIVLVLYNSKSYKYVIDINNHAAENTIKTLSVYMVDHLAVLSIAYT